MTKFTYFAAFAAIGLMATGAQAAENGTLQYSVGSSGFTAAGMPPMPGIYTLSQTSVTYADRLNDGNGDKLPIDYRLRATAETLRTLFISDVDVLGGKLWGQIVLPLVNLDLTVPYGKQSKFGLADMTVTAGVVWHVDQQNQWAFGLDVAVPTGAYDSKRIANVGLNHGSLQPTVAYHHTDPNGWEFATSVRAIVNDRNDDTDYRSGNVIVADYALGYTVNAWRYGVSGYYLKQVSDDSGPNVGADGNRMQGFGIGPSISYLPHPGAMYTLSLQKDVVAKNMAQGGIVMLSATVKF